MNSKAKIVYIYECGNDCKYFYDLKCYARSTVGRWVEWHKKKPFPSWCPLPDAPDKDGVDEQKDL